MNPLPPPRPVQVNSEELEEAGSATAMTPGAPAVAAWDNASPAESTPEASAAGEGLDLDDVYIKIIESPREQWSSLVQQCARGNAEVEQTLWRVLGDEPAIGICGTLVPDTRVGDRYRLIKEIGGGTSAVVWHAWDKDLSRYVALKIFRKSADEPTIRASIREAQSSSRIVSDYVVRIYNTFVDRARGLAAIEMELCFEILQDGTEVSGASLATMVTREGVTNEAGARRSAIAACRSATAACRFVILV